MKYSTVKANRYTYILLIWIIILFIEALQCGDGEKCLGYVGTNAEPLSVEFCTFCNVISS
jgi:hypothetical protein